MRATLLPAPTNQHSMKTGDRLGTVRVAGLKNYPDLVAELGGNPSKLLTGCGLDPQILNDSENVIPIGTIDRLLALTAEEIQCPNFGLLMGQRHKQYVVNEKIGFLMQNSPTVRAALHSLKRYFQLEHKGITLELLLQEPEVVYSIDLPGTLGSIQFQDYAMTHLLTIMRMLCGRAWRPSAVHFAHRPPVDITPYRDLFSAPFYFDQEVTGLRFPDFWLDRSLPDADPDLYHIMQNYMSKIEQQYSGDFSGQVRRVVRTMLPTGKCTAVRLAELFSMNRSTLHRRLNANGTTFEAMLDAVRHDIAARNLIETNKPISQLAAMLGYRDTSAFTRAFRRWSNVAPSEWRTQHRN